MENLHNRTVHRSMPSVCSSAFLKLCTALFTTIYVRIVDSDISLSVKLLLLQNNCRQIQQQFSFVLMHRHSAIIQITFLINTIIQYY